MWYTQDWQSASGSVAAAAAGDVWCTSQQFLDVLAGETVMPVTVAFVTITY
jgi:hypothetical protein